MLDEAHRGIGKPSVASQSAKSTLVQRLINGSGNVKGIPVVWGISATVDRFNKAMEGAVGRIKLPDVLVDATKVQDSGLIKDTILLDYRGEAGDVDTVLVRRATDKLVESTKAWADYAGRQEDTNSVVPLMVLQVPNTRDPNEIGRWLDIICERYPTLTTSNFAHVLGDHTTQRYGNRDVLYIEPQRVQEAHWVRVLIAKDAISTGWDCPRAEVMVSFRPANDQTYITQLLGRMVRSPLARRIPGDDRLNTVDCLLPKFDRQTVESAVKALTEGDDGSQATPRRILIKPVQVNPNPDVPQGIWDLFTSLPSQLVKPEAKFEPTKALENGNETDLTTWKNHLLCDKDRQYPAELNGWERKVLETESKRDGFKFWYRNPQQSGQSSLGIAYIEADQHKVVRPDFVFFAEHEGKLVADLVDPHGLQFADALAKLQGLATYAENHLNAYRRIESVAEANGVLRSLNLQRSDVRDAIKNAKEAGSLFRSSIASDYFRASSLTC